MIISLYVILLYHRKLNYAVSCLFMALMLFDYTFILHIYCMQITYRLFTDYTSITYRLHIDNL